MAKCTLGLFMLSLMGVLTACGSDGQMSQEPLQEADVLEPAALEAAPETSREGENSSLAGDSLTAGDLSLGLKADQREDG